MIETFGNHFVELIAPFFIFLTRPFRIAGGVIQIAFQASQSKEFLQIIKTLQLSCLQIARLMKIFLKELMKVRKNEWKNERSNKLMKE